MNRWRSALLTVCSIVVVACSDAESLPAGPDAEDVATVASAGSVSTGYARLPIRGSAINNAGTIVGNVVVGGETRAAVLDRSGTLTLLPGLGGGFSSASDINERGEIVGSAETPEGALHAILWRRGDFEDLGTLGGENSWAVGINERGQVSGTSETEGGPRAFLWTGGRMVALAPLPHGTYSWGYGVNDRGVVVGWSGGGAFIQRATMWAPNRVVDLGTLSFEASAVQVNNRGQAVGGSIPERQPVVAATLFDRGRTIDLGYLVAPCEPRFSAACSIASSANAINARGQIVGTFGDNAFLWDNGGMTQLFQEDPARPPVPVDINDSGTVLGQDGELWGKIPAALAKLASTQIAAASTRRAGTARPWAASYCAARGALVGPGTELDRAARCPVD